MLAKTMAKVKKVTVHRPRASGITKGDADSIEPDMEQNDVHILLTSIPNF